MKQLNDLEHRIFNILKKKQGAVKGSVIRNNLHEVDVDESKKAIKSLKRKGYIIETSTRSESNNKRTFYYEIAVVN